MIEFLASPLWLLVLVILSAFWLGWHVADQNWKWVVFWLILLLVNGIHLVTKL